MSEGAYHEKNILPSEMRAKPRMVPEVLAIPRESAAIHDVHASEYSTHANKKDVGIFENASPVESEIPINQKKENIFAKTWKEVVSYGKTAKHAWGHGSWSERLAIALGGLLTISGIVLSMPFVHTAITGAAAATIMLKLSIPIALAVPVYVASSLLLGLGLIVSGMLVTKFFSPTCFKEHTFKIGKQIISGIGNGLKKVGNVFSKNEQEKASA